MRLRTIYDLADEIAPFSLSEQFCKKYDCYDNSGILLDCGREVNKILFSLDCSKLAVERAKKIGAQCVFTHHPAIYSPLHKIEKNGAGSEILACAEAGISIISAHLNLDCAPNGIDETLMRRLGGEKESVVCCPLEGGGYGRAFEREELSLEEFVREVKEKFSTERTFVYGNGRVKKIASFCGAGLDEHALSFAKEQGADTLVSADGKHHVIAAAIDAGLNVIMLTHYASEIYGFYEFYLKIKEKSNVECEFMFDERML